MRQHFAAAALCAAAMSVCAPAFACTCPPLESAAAQAERYDLIAVVTVGEEFELKTDAETAELEARQEFLDGYIEALEGYIDAVESGEEIMEFAGYIDQFYETSTYRPAPYSAQSYLTAMKVEQVIKGEASGVVLVRSASPGMPACGVRYREGTEVLLLARGGEGVYSTWMCDAPQFPVEAFETLAAE